MVDTNPQSNSNPNSGQKQQNDLQKPSLVWSQPTTNTNQQTKPALGKVADTTISTSNNPDSSGRLVGIIVGTIVVFALVVWGIATLHNHTTNDTTGVMGASTEATATTAALSADTGTTVGGLTTEASSTTGIMNATFTISSPQAAGTGISITNMRFSQPTWVIVYESRRGTPTNILGAGLFFPTNTSGTVQLLRATVAGQTYVVTAAIDNGDKLFSIKDESPVLDQNGKQVWITFQAN